MKTKRNSLLFCEKFPFHSVSNQLNEIYFRFLKWFIMRLLLVVSRYAAKYRDLLVFFHRNLRSISRFFLVSLSRSNSRICISSFNQILVCLSCVILQGQNTVTSVMWVMNFWKLTFQHAFLKNFQSFIKQKALFDSLFRADVLKLKCSCDVLMC